MTVSVQMSDWYIMSGINSSLCISITALHVMHLKILEKKMSARFVVYQNISNVKVIKHLTDKVSKS